MLRRAFTPRRVSVQGLALASYGPAAGLNGLLVGGVVHDARRA